MDRIEQLLEKTSRTFALSIPLLPEPTRRELGIAYLLFRVADTFEDAVHWAPDRKAQAFDDFAGLLRTPDADRGEQLGLKWAAEVPIDNEGYQELLRDTGLVIAELAALSQPARELIASHAERTARGMLEFVERTVDGVLRLQNLDELRGYCYAVAGIVGELSTELFLLGREQLQPLAADLRARAPRFGEALQLVNILKDSSFDTDEGRCFLPASVPRAGIFAMAREDLGIAGEYTRALQSGNAPRGVVAFCALPVRLAWAALQRVEEVGPGAKISRDTVWRIVGELNEALDRGEPAVSPSAALTPP